MEARESRSEDVTLGRPPTPATATDVPDGRRTDALDPPPSDHRTDAAGEEPAAPLNNPFAFNLYNAVLLGIAAAVMLALVILNMTGVIR